MEMYRVYDKNLTEPDALDIRHCFTEEGAKAEVERQAKKGREAAYDTFTPQCYWGRCTGTPCQNEATWFDATMDTYGATCDEHYHPEWMTRKLRFEEKARRELGGVTLVAPDLSEGSEVELSVRGTIIKQGKLC